MDKRRFAWAICGGMVLLTLSLNGQPSLPALNRASAVTATAAPIRSAVLPTISVKNAIQLTRLMCLTVDDKNGLSQVWSPMWSPNGEKLAAVGDKGVWTFPTQAMPQTPQLLAGQVSAILGFSRNSDDLVSVKTDGTIMAWDITTGRLLVATQDSTGESWVLSPTGQLVASFSGRDARVRLWDVRTGQQVGSLNNSDWPVAFSPDGLQLAVTDWENGRLTLYDTASLRERMALVRSELTNGVHGLTFSPDGNLLAIGIQNAIWLWNLKTNQVQETEGQAYADGLQDIIFSPDNTKFISWGRATVYLWATLTGTRVANLEGHGFDHLGVTFSPDSTLIATWDWGPNGNRTRLWNATTGQALTTLEGPWNVTFNPDGKLFAADGLSGTVELWGIAHSDQLSCPT